MKEEFIDILQKYESFMIDSELTSSLLVIIIIMLSPVAVFTGVYKRNWGLFTIGFITFLSSFFMLMDPDTHKNGFQSFVSSLTIEEKQILNEEIFLTLSVNDKQDIKTKIQNKISFNNIFDNFNQNKQEIKTKIQDKSPDFLFGMKETKYFFKPETINKIKEMKMERKELEKETIRNELKTS